MAQGLTLLALFILPFEYLLSVNHWSHIPSFTALGLSIGVYLISSVLRHKEGYPALYNLVAWMPLGFGKSIFLWLAGFLFPIWIAVGWFGNQLSEIWFGTLLTGFAIAYISTGDADAVLVHAPEAERGYVQSGDLVEGRRIMHNDFLIVGPANDPVRAAGANGLIEALRRIAAGGAFISRGDGSGTERKELELWKAAGVQLGRILRREETGQSMGATLVVASERRGYTLTDRGTYLALRSRLDLVPLVEDDPRLFNVYHAYVVNPARHPKVKPREARALVEFLVSERAQRIIGSFGTGRFGTPLFVPDAGKGSR
jgi:tungstate transport system substrate-binding protein